MVKISFTGDIMSWKPQNVASQKKDGSYDYSPIFEHIKAYLHSADYVVGNLETPIAGQELAYTEEDTVFNTPSEFLDAIKKAGFDYLSLANNHCLDRKFVGLVNTIANVKKYGFDFGGAYLSNEEAKGYSLIDVKGIKIALFSYTYGTNSAYQDNELPDSHCFCVDLIRKQDKYLNIHPRFVGMKTFIKKVLPHSILNIIRPIVVEDCASCIREYDEKYLNRLSVCIEEAKKEADILFMYLHCGGQFNSVVGEYTNSLVERIKLYGIPNIIVNHPHCVLNHQIHNDGGMTAFALGNFCFTPGYGDYQTNVYADYSIVLSANIDEGTKKIRQWSYYITKSVRERNGHSVVYHVKDLYKKINSRQRRRLYDDCLGVLSRFYGKNIESFEITKEEHPI